MAAANKIVPKHGSCERNRNAMVEVLSRLGDKWTILIVATLNRGPMRYGDLQRAIGDISQRMLTLTLKNLTDDGLVRRTAFATIPPRVDYELTERGLSLRAALLPLREWAIENIDAIETSRAYRKVRTD
jgi:DNA-binding HxlR family transcriptional regulator